MPFRRLGRRASRRSRLAWRTKSGLRLKPFGIRRRVYSRSMLNRTIQVHRFKRWTQFVTDGVANVPISGLTYINVGNPGFTGYALQFKLSNLPNFNEFSALYDQFCITKVVIKFYPYRDKAENTNTAPGGGQSGGRLLTAIDHDDSTAPVPNDIRQYSTCRSTDLDRIHTRVITPAVLRQMYESNIATAYTPSFHQWLSTTDSDTPHFGLKAVVIANDPGAATNTIQYSIEATYYFKCKNVK